MRLFLLSIIAVSAVSCKGFGVRLEVGYKDWKVGGELTPPQKVEPQK